MSDNVNYLTFKNEYNNNYNHASCIVNLLFILRKQAMFVIVYNIKETKHQ